MNLLPILISIPHCSTFVPAELRRLMLLSDFEIKKSADPFTDEIFNASNAHVVKAKISRLVADPNRAPDDIEMECQLCADGVVVSIDENGKQIYREPPSEKAIFERVKKYHTTFHAEIEKLKPKMKFLIDGHSMWSVAPATKSDAGKARPDVCLGNRDFTTCSRSRTLKILKFFQKKGLSVNVNKPFGGKFVIGEHCSRHRLPGIQIEFNHKLYLNEKTLRPRKKDVEKLNKIIFELVEILAREI
ncbi:N-formylglutamate amidohydrolase [Patescibacteria group bacterium]|nr:N-formylglutamate amidohydrolase [Patescibacteria group bacterium]